MKAGVNRGATTIKVKRKAEGKHSRYQKKLDYPRCTAQSISTPLRTKNEKNEQRGGNSKR
jgi:hypothetical protein